MYQRIQENPEKGKYSLQVYDKNGAKKLECKLNMNYDSIQMWGKEIIAVARMNVLY